MAHYRISGYWKDGSGSIAVYAVHYVLDDAISKSARKSKQQVIALLEENNSVTTMMWNYKISKWNEGKAVQLRQDGNTKYLQSDLNDPASIDLAHLICFNIIENN